MWGYGKYPFFAMNLQYLSPTPLLEKGEGSLTPRDNGLHPLLFQGEGRERFKLKKGILVIYTTKTIVYFYAKNPIFIVNKC
jgi:hypothetical protein